MFTVDYFTKHFRSNLLSGLIVCLVAIPLCLGIALASGTPLIMGIWSGVIGGIVVGLISQSKVSVSGPATAMIGLTIGAIAELHSISAFLLALALSGIVQVIIGAFKAGFIADYFPSNVIKGLLCAIGILIIIKQIPFAFGYFQQGPSLTQSLMAAHQSFSIKPLALVLQNIHPGALIISVLSLATLIFWKKTPLKNYKWLPAPIVVIVIGVLINTIYSWFSKKLFLPTEHLVNLPSLSSSKGGNHFFIHPDWGQFSNPKIYIWAFTLGLISSVCSLLNLEAAEQIDPQRRYCNRSRELVAQGFANIIAGLVGALPVSSVIIRSSVNIEAGCKNQWSTIFQGLMLLASLLLIPTWINAIPLASLAAILIYTGYRLANYQVFKAMYKEGFPHFFPFIVTIAVIIFFGLLNGIVLGMCVSFYYILKYSSNRTFDKYEEAHTFGKVTRIVLPEQASFLTKAALINELKALKEKSKVIIDARFARYLDNDIVSVIHDFEHELRSTKKISLRTVGLKEQYKEAYGRHLTLTIDRVAQQKLTPTKILALLKKGNKRFRENQLIHRDVLMQLKATAHTQHPMAVVISCMDSRVPIETIFDLGIGDTFVIRVAGNVVNSDIIASVEYGCLVAGSKLVVILGHTKCGAIHAACKGASGGHIGELVDKMKPAIEVTEAEMPSKDKEDPTFLQAVMRHNVTHAQKQLCALSESLNQQIKDGTIGLVGAYYDIETGKVHFDKHLHK